MPNIRRQPPPRRTSGTGERTTWRDFGAEFLDVQWFDFDEDAMEAYWHQHAEGITADSAARAPGERQDAWWKFEAPEPRREGETTFAYLKRLRLLLPGEREARREKRRKDLEFLRSPCGRSQYSAGYEPPGDDWIDD